MIDMRTVGYDAEMITETGTKYELNNVLISLQWEEQKNELAQRATITVANMAMNGTWLMAIIKINCIIRIFGKWNGTRALMFEGTIWDWQYRSATQKELTIVAYDPLIRLQQSKDFKFFSAGLNTKDLIARICEEWNIPFVYNWKQSITHEKKVFNAVPISDMIIGVLDEVRKKTGEGYVAYFRDGKLQITDYGTNETVYKFDTQNTTSTLNKMSMNDLVTRVKVIGKQNKEGRAPVDAVLDGDTRFGVLQEIVRRDTSKTLETAMAEARTIIKDRGKPEEIIQTTVPDVPAMRKGDLVEMAAGNLLGFFYVEGVAHNAAMKQMDLTLSRKE